MRVKRPIAEGNGAVSKSLKDRNTARLVAVCAVNLAAYVAVLQGQALLALDWQQVLKATTDFFPAGLGVVFVSVVNGLMSPQAKARLVFWRWRHPLPGCRAFTVHAKNDPRINLPALRSRLGSLPKFEAEQNAAWYKMYRTIQADPAVAHVHKEYLFTRDYASLSALMFVVLGSVALWQAGAVPQAALYLLFLAAQYAIVRFAAANYGQRFVCTVLAIKSAGA